MNPTPFKVEVLEIIEVTGGLITPAGVAQLTGRSAGGCLMTMRMMWHEGLLRPGHALDCYRITDAGVRALRQATRQEIRGYFR